jgi:hypothetical protein
MKLKIFRSVLFTIIFVITLGLVRPVRAHVGQPRLEISVERMNPGGIVDVRGVEFDYEEKVSLYLERTGIVIQLGEVVADLEGVFLHVVVLPVDLPEGVYNIRAVTSHHDVLSPALTVQGPAILSEGGGQGERDEDDGLLAPMPTYAPGVVPGGVVQPTNVVELVPEQTPVSSVSPMLLLGLSILLVLAVFFVFRRRAVSKG